MAEVLDAGVLELETELLGDDLAAGEDCDVFEHRLSAVAVTGGLHRRATDDAAEFIHDEHSKGLALDILGDDDERHPALGDLFE